MLGLGGDFAVDFKAKKLTGLCFWGRRGQEYIQRKRAEGCGEVGMSSAGVEKFDQKLVGELFGQVTKPKRVSSTVATNLPMIEDHRERVG